MNWLLPLVLTAWPLPPDAGREAYAEPQNWPHEPAWTVQWPLLSFTPANDWNALAANERDAGVGMSVDRAFSVTRGDPNVTIAVLAPSFETADPVLARAFKLNAGEFPDAGDQNGNGRLDVGDFASDTRVTDRNGNQQLDLDDVLQSLADGVDQDQNGRTDDLCGWDFDGSRALVRDGASNAELSQLVAPIDDGLAGVGTCPGCTVLPIVDSSAERGLEFAIASGARVVLIRHFDAELSPRLLTALDAGVVVVTIGSGELPSWPLATHPAVLSPRTLTKASDGTTALSRSGCGGSARGNVSVSTTSCSAEAANAIAGIAALVISANPSLDAQQVRGLLGGERLDAFAAVTRAQGLAAAPARLDTVGAQVLPISAATRCFFDGVEVRCDGGLVTGMFEAPIDLKPERAFSLYVEEQGASSWATWLAAPPQGARRGLLELRNPGWGSRAPRYVDLSTLETDELVFASKPGTQPFAIARVDADRQPDTIEIANERELFVNGALAETLDAGVIGGPIALSTLDGTALITVERTGRITSRVGGAVWVHELGVSPTSGAAAGKIDGDDTVDLALTDGALVHVLINDSRGPTPASWTAASRAREALLANVAGDAQLEVIAEKVFDSRGVELAQLENWAPSDWPALLTRVDETASRALVQIEARGDGRFDVARYDLEKALRGGDQVVARKLVTTLSHTPSAGGMAAVDVTGDRKPELIIPTLDGLIFLVDLDGQSPPESPLSAWGTVISGATVGVRDDHVEWSVRNTRGDLLRFLSRGVVNDITWDGPGHDEGNTKNAETPFHARRITGLGIVDPPILQPMCGCSGLEGSAVLAALIFLLRRRARC